MKVNLLLSNSSNEDVPSTDHPGYIKAVLTVGHGTTEYGEDAYGFSISRGFGELSVSTYTDLMIYDADYSLGGQKWYGITSTKPFYFKNTQYYEGLMITGSNPFEQYNGSQVEVEVQT